MKYTIHEDGMVFYSMGKIVMDTDQYLILVDHDDNLKAIEKWRIVNTETSEGK